MFRPEQQQPTQADPYLITATLNVTSLGPVEARLTAGNIPYLEFSSGLNTFGITTNTRLMSRAEQSAFWRTLAFAATSLAEQVDELGDGPPVVRVADNGSHVPDKHGIAS